MILGIAVTFVLLFEGLRRISRFIIWIFQWKRSQEWLSTHGKIIQSNLQNVRVPAGGRKSHNIDGSVRSVTAYVPDIVYEYRANAEAFQSRQIFIGQQFPSSLSFSNEFVEKYPVGKEVTVFYDPEQPELATLERDRLKELLLYLVGGVLDLLIGFAVLIQVIHE